jgi:peptidoglycan/LPS O-acetylase OafA/YrhL
VLSGFLITSILLRADKTAGYFSTFYLRRALRIFPLYYAYLAGWLLYGLSLKDTWWFWLYVGNWRQAFAGSPRGFHHLWSLSIEEQFYFLWPMVVFLVPARKLWIFCLATFVGSFALSLAYEMNGLSPVAIYYMTPFRMGALAVGGLLATLDVERLEALLKLLVPISVLSLFGLFWIVVMTPSWPATIGYIFLAVGFCGVVAECVVRRGSGELLVSLLRNPVLRSFGKYSYAIYVLHLVVVAVVFPRLWGAVSRLPFGLAALASILLMMALFYVAGMLSWYVLERHFLALKDRIPQTERVTR